MRAPSSRASFRSRAAPHAPPPLAGAVCVAATGCALLCVCAELEEKIPWSAVKKKWTPKRQSWLNSVEHAGTTAAVAKRLCMLEAALKQESLDDSWVTLKDAWRSTVRKPLPCTRDALPRALRARPGEREDRLAALRRAQPLELAAREVLTRAPS